MKNKSEDVATTTIEQKLQLLNETVEKVSSMIEVIELVSSELLDAEKLPIDAFLIRNMIRATKVVRYKLFRAEYERLAKLL